MPAYCSRECQALDWKSGHKQLCQKKASDFDSFEDFFKGYSTLGSRLNSPSLHPSGWHSGVTERHACWRLTFAALVRAEDENGANFLIYAPRKDFSFFEDGRECELFGSDAYCDWKFDVVDRTSKSVVAVDTSGGAKRKLYARGNPWIKKTVDSLLNVLQQWPATEAAIGAMLRAWGTPSWWEQGRHMELCRAIHRDWERGTKGGLHQWDNGAWTSWRRVPDIIEARFGGCSQEEILLRNLTQQTRVEGYGPVAIEKVGEGRSGLGNGLEPRIWLEHGESCVKCRLPTLTRLGLGHTCFRPLCLLTRDALRLAAEFPIEGFPRQRLEELAENEGHAFEGDGDDEEEEEYYEGEDGEDVDDGDEE